MPKPWKRFLLFTLLYVASTSAFASVCPKDNLGEYLAHEEPRVKEFIQKLSPEQSVEGFTLCDGEILFKDWRYLGQVKQLAKGQRVFLFQDKQVTKAVAWVERNGVPLLIPSCPKQYNCLDEGQWSISGDVYTWKSIQPEGTEGEGIVILSYPSKQWVVIPADDKE